MMARRIAQHSEPDRDAGPVLGRYELLMRIASGGMATVWAARLRGPRGFQKILALKTILPRLCDDAKYERMFLDEATLASQIRHPNVAQIFDLGEDNGVLFLAMEWIDGVTLDELLREARAGGIEIPLSVAIRIAMQAASGLHAAHELRDGDQELVGLVHGDVSPQNIVVSFEGITKIVDFGLARLTAEGQEDSVESAQVRGKAAYLAPEQIMGDAIDRRVDVFALGIVLYVLTTGTHPFEGRTAAATLCNISGPDRARPPSEFVEDYPTELEAAVLRCLEKNPGRRFATSDELVWALESSVPPELRATDEDVAALVRPLAGEFGARRWRALRSASGASKWPARPSTIPARDPFLTADESRTIVTPSRGQRNENADAQTIEHRPYAPLLLCAALMGTTAALALGSTLWTMTRAPQLTSITADHDLPALRKLASGSHPVALPTAAPANATAPMPPQGAKHKAAILRRSSKHR
jgi:serine/threonine protein kinase